MLPLKCCAHCAAAIFAFLIVFPCQMGRGAQSRLAGPASELRRPGSDIWFEKDDRALGISFELYRNHIFLKARVGESHPVSLLLDTGSSVSILNLDRAAALGLDARGESQFSAVGGPVTGATISGVSFQLPGARIDGQTVGAISFGAVESEAGRQIDGLLGGDFFTHFVVEIDYANRKVNLYDPQLYQYVGSGEVIPLSLASSTPRVPARVTLGDGRSIDATFEIDTGDGRAIDLATPFVLDHGVLAGTRTTIPGPNAAELGGYAHQRIGRLKRLQLGRTVMKCLIANFSLESEGLRASPERAGMIGGEFLRRLKVIFDYSRSRLIIEPNKEIGELDEYDMSGMDLIAGPGFKDFEVRAVIPNSPAADAGVRPGDRILAVDRKLADRFDLDQLERMFKSEGAQHQLLIKRNEQLLQLKISLRRLV